jgi:hypothetical protein
VQAAVVGFGVGAAVGFRVRAAVGCGTGHGSEWEKQLVLGRDQRLGSDREQQMAASERNEKFLRETSEWLQQVASE